MSAHAAICIVSNGTSLRTESTFTRVIRMDPLTGLKETWLTGKRFSYFLNNKLHFYVYRKPTELM